MTWYYAYTPSIWPSFLTALFMLVIAFYSGRRSVPGARPFMIGCLFAAAWAAGSGLELAAADLAGKIFWVKFQTAFQLPAVTTMTCFVLEYAWPGRWLTRRNLVYLSIAPLLVLGMILTDPIHHWMWNGFKYDESLNPQLGPASWISILYSFVLVILNLVLLVRLYLHSPQHRWPVAIMVLGHVEVRVLYVLEKINLVHSMLPLDVYGVAFMVVLYAIALFAFGLFDPIPMARQMVIEQLRDGVLVLDPQWRVTSLNPTAEKILGASLKQARGRSIEEVLPKFNELSLPLTSIVTFKHPIEIQLKPGNETRGFELVISPLDDFRGLPVGRLLILHDLTEQRRSQAQILEQQRALAILNERERLARELHDELSQNLALINLQAQLVSGLFETGQDEQAQAQLKILAKAAREAQVDVRGEISKLSLSISQEKGCLGVLKNYVETFQQSFGIETELVISGSEPAITFTPLVEAQLLRIVQEAFTNIRKHAQAMHVQVALTREPGCLKLMIEDDGVGFDPERLSTSRQTFGLEIMSKRAEDVNGWVDVKSSPGKGTRVTVVVPANA